MSGLAAADVVRWARGARSRYRTLHALLRDWSDQSAIALAQGLQPPAEGDWVWEKRVEILVDGDRVREDGARPHPSVSILSKSQPIYAHMLDPVWLESVDGLVLIGDRECAGRQGYEIAAAGGGFPTFSLLPGADEERHVVDAETGIRLKSTALLDGEVLLLEEMLELALDIEVDVKTFAGARHE